MGCRNFIKTDFSNESRVAVSKPHYFSYELDRQINIIRRLRLLLARRRYMNERSWAWTSAFHLISKADAYVEFKDLVAQIENEDKEKSAALKRSTKAIYKRKVAIESNIRYIQKNLRKLLDEHAAFTKLAEQQMQI